MISQRSNWKSIFSRRARTVRLVTVVLLAGALISLRSFVDAAPITLAFEATVGPPPIGNPGDVPFGLPFSFSEGDTILGQISVDPLDVGDEVNVTSRIVALEVRWRINGYEFGTSQYSIQVQDDLFTSDFPVMPHDEIAIGCSPFGGLTAVCVPNVIDESQNTVVGFTLGLLGDQSILNGADIPGSAEDWNTFSSKGLSMTFQESIGNGIVRLTATVGAFVQVPEPNGIALAGFVVISSMVVRRSRRASNRS